jgi:hypothetical protein
VFAERTVYSADIILAGIIWAVLGVAIAVIAALRGRPFWPWLLYSIAFWPLAALHLIFNKHRRREAGPLDEDV